MNYFFELLDSYKHRGCCVTRIDEAAKKDPNFTKRITQVSQYLASVSINAPDMKIGGTQPKPVRTPGGQYNTTTSKQDTVYVTDIVNTRESIRHNISGRIFKPTDRKKLKAIATMILGPDGTETQQKQKQKKAKTPKQTLPNFDPEKAREEAAKNKQNTTIEKGIRDIVSQYDENAICRAQLHIENLATILRPDRDKKASIDYKALQKLTGTPVSQSARTFLVKTFNDYYSKIQKSNDEACNFKKALEKVARLEPTLTDFINDKFISGTVEQAVINMVSRNKNSIVNSIEYAHDPKVSETLEMLLNGECSPEDPCAASTDVPEAQKKAIRETVLVLLELAAKDKLNEEEKELLKSLIMVTDDRRIAVAGVNMTDSVIIPDRGRAFLDMVKFIESKHGIEFTTLNLLEELAEGGSDNSAIGTLFEHWFSFIGLSLDPKLTDEQKKIILNSYYRKIGNMCKTLQSIQKRIKAMGKDPGAIPIHEHEKIAEIEFDMTECSDLKQINRLLTSRVTASYFRSNPDFVVQTGKAVGKGARSDIMLGFHTKEAALASAKQSGLSSRAVKKQKLGDLLALNPEFETILKASGVMEEGGAYDPNQEIYTVPSGLKTSSGKTSSVATGSSFFKSIAEDLEDPSSPWVQNVSKSLGIGDQAVARARSIVSKMDKIDTVVSKKIDAVIDGVRESPAKLTATILMDEILDQSVEGLKNQSDEVFRSCQAYIKLLNTSNPDPADLEHARTLLSGALKKRILEQELFKYASSPKRVDREGAGLILGMVGGVNRDQSLEYADLGSDDHYVVDHNSLAVEPIKNMLEDPSTATFSRAARSFGIKIQCPDGSNISIRFTNTSGGSINGKSSVSKSMFTTGCGGKKATKLVSEDLNAIFALLKHQLKFINELINSN